MDPTGRGRLQVVVPDIGDRPPSWALTVVPLGRQPSDPNPIGAEVWVSFENGDVEYPVVVGQLPTLDVLPPVETMTTPSVVHVVLIRWKPEVGQAALEELTELTGAFADAIPGVLAVHCGPNTNPEGLGGGFDWALIVSFASSSARDDYLPHPAHQPVAQMISQLADQVVVFDVDA